MYSSVIFWVNSGLILPKGCLGWLFILQNLSQSQHFQDQTRYLLPYAGAKLGMANFFQSGPFRRLQYLLRIQQPRPNQHHRQPQPQPNMQQINLDATLLQNLKSKTAIITGAAGGIGLATTHLLLSNGANVVMADMPHAQATAEEVIASLPDPRRAVFVPTNTVNWGQMTAVFKTAKERFGSVEVVVANAGVMESEMLLDVDGDRRVDENGDLKECGEFSKVVDVNVKGTMNSKCLFACLGLFIGSRDII